MQMDSVLSLWWIWIMYFMIFCTHVHQISGWQQNLVFIIVLQALRIDCLFSQASIRIQKEFNSRSPPSSLTYFFIISIMRIHYLITSLAPLLIHFVQFFFAALLCFLHLFCIWWFVCNFSLSQFTLSDFDEFLQWSNTSHSTHSSIVLLKFSMRHRISCERLFNALFSYW